MTTEEARASEVLYPMARATWRDVLPLAWRLSVEFTRPTRTWGPFLPATLVLLPIFAGVAAMPGVYHWERTAVLGLYRPEEGKRQRSGVVAYVAIMMLVELGLLFAAFGRWAIVVWTGSLIGAIGIPRAMGAMARLMRLVPRRDRADRKARHSVTRLRRRSLVSSAQAPPRSDWVASVAACRPTTGVRALPDIFLPHVRATVPAGDTVELVAASGYLASVYRTQFGFEQVGASALRLRATL